MALKIVLPDGCSDVQRQRKNLSNSYHRYLADLNQKYDFDIIRHIYHVYLFVHFMN